MAFTGSIHNDGVASFILNTAITSKYLAMYQLTGADNTVDVAASQANAVTFVGISQETNPINAKDAIAVKTNGFSLAQCGGTVTIGAKLTVTTGGKLIATTTATDKVVAIALTNGANGEVIEVKILPFPMLYSSF